MEWRNFWRTKNSRQSAEAPVEVQPIDTPVDNGTNQHEVDITTDWQVAEAVPNCTFHETLFPDFVAAKMSKDVEIIPHNADSEPIL